MTTRIKAATDAAPPTDRTLSSSPEWGDYLVARQALLATELAEPARRICELLTAQARRAGQTDLVYKIGYDMAAAALPELLPGHAPWRAQSDAALARVALARGFGEDAVRSAMSALAHLQSALQEDLHVEILLPVAEVVMAAGSHAEQQLVQFFLQLMLAMTAQRTLDEEVRVLWFRGPVGRRLAELAGSPEEMAMRPQEVDAGPPLDQADTQLVFFEEA